MTKRVFIFGSGSSVQAGFPFARDFIVNIKKHLDSSTILQDPKFKDEFNRLVKQAKDLSPLLLEDIELFFTYLDLFNKSIRIDPYGELFLEIENITTFRGNLSGAILEWFETIHCTSSISKRTTLGTIETGGIRSGNNAQPFKFRRARGDRDHACAG